MSDPGVALEDEAQVAASRPAPGAQRIANWLFVAANVVLCVWPLIPELMGGGKHKDYPLWYAVGRAVLGGEPLYTPDPSGAFAFLYPPFAAVLMAPFSLLGRGGMILCLSAVNVVSWWIAAKLSDRLAGVDGARPWWLIVLPSVLVLSAIYDMYDLGQPNLMLLAMVLGGVALLQMKRDVPAGALFAAAAALKAFPLAILPYLLWRRRWRAALSMTLMTAVFLLLAPAPFRGFERNLAEVKTWAGGMVFSASEKGFGQRPAQNWGWKNNSLIAVTHRYVRPINAEAEKPSAPPIYVNLLNLTYDQANLVLLGLAGLIGLAFVAALPSERRRTPASDGAEYAILIALMTIASPLARGYYFVWLLFPYTVLAYRAALDPKRGVRMVAGWALGAAAALFFLGFDFHLPHWPQALGAQFWGTMVVIAALTWLMRREIKLAPAPTPA